MHIVDLSDQRTGGGRQHRLDDRLAALQVQGYDTVVIVDRRCRVTYVSPVASTAFGYEPEDLLRRWAWTWVHPDDLAQVSVVFQEALSSPGTHDPITLRVRDAAGRWRWVEQRFTNAVDDLAVNGLIVHSCDLGASGAADRSACAEIRWQVLLEVLAEGIWLVDRSGTVTYVNSAAARMAGRTVDELLGSALGDVLADVATVLGVGEGLLDGWVEHTVLIPAREDTQRWWVVRATPIPAGLGARAGVIVATRDVTAQRQAQLEAHRLATHDHLTGLPNRSGVIALADDWLRTSSLVPVSALHCDLDHFRYLAGSLTASAADQVICAIADRVKREAPASAAVARTDSDEFVLLCPSTTLEQARDVASRVLRAVAKPIKLATTTVRLTASIGIGISPASSGQELLLRASAALANAKSVGGGQARVFSDEHVRRPRERLRMRNDLFRAFDAGELQLHFQPIVDLPSGAPIGVEALLRWMHPVRGQISPEKFIPLAESGGLISEIGAMALRETCRALRRWDSQLTDLRFASVNLSARQLHDPSLLPQIRQIMAQSGTAPKRLILEITETAAVSDANLRVIRQLKALGVGIALDDFGTGYAGLAQLKRIPMDHLKIDRGFVSGLVPAGDQSGPHPGMDGLVVATIAALAQGVGLGLVAEGVESMAQADLLHRMGCRLAQGYLWSPAVPAQDLPAVWRGLRQRAGVLVERKDLAGIKVAPSVTARIATMDAAGHSRYSIAAALNREALPSPFGRRWHHSSVTAVLRAIKPARARTDLRGTNHDV